jgi:hypothetical protein
MTLSCIYNLQTTSASFSLSHVLLQIIFESFSGSLFLVETESHCRFLITVIHLDHLVVLVNLI